MPKQPKPRIDEMADFDGNMELDEALDARPFARQPGPSEARARAMIAAWLADVRKAVRQ